MSITYRAYMRAVGPDEALSALRRKVLAAESEDFSYDFEMRVLNLYMADHVYGFSVKGEVNRREVAFACIDFEATEYQEHPGLVVELLNEADDNQTHSVYQGGRLIYRAQ